MEFSEDDLVMLGFALEYTRNKAILGMEDRQQLARLHRTVTDHRAAA